MAIDRVKLKQQLITGTRNQKAVVEFQDPGWLVMHEDGQIEEWDTADWAMKAILKRARKRNPGITITNVEWRNVPVGFVPPGGKP